MRRARALAIALTLAGCGTRVLLGSDGEDAGTASDSACDGAWCGAPCTLPSKGGAGAPSGVCDAHGACIDGAPTCPPLPQCLGQPCGTLCDLCPFENLGGCGSFGPGQCDGQAQCVFPPAMGPGCPPPNPCEGQGCGMPCDPCLGMMLDAGCGMPGPHACDGMGHCVHADMGMCMPPYVPCAQKMCGSPCMVCGPMEPGCMEPPGPHACNAMGFCDAQPPMCP